MKRRGFIGVVCGALGAVVAGLAGANRAQASKGEVFHANVPGSGKTALESKVLPGRLIYGEDFDPRDLPQGHTLKVSRKLREVPIREHPEFPKFAKKIETERVGHFLQCEWRMELRNEIGVLVGVKICRGGTFMPS